VQQFSIDMAEPDPQTILPALRVKFGLSDIQLAEWFGVTRMTVYRWENGLRKTPLLYLWVAQGLLSARDPRPILRLLGPKP
jgi:hypothetical protein